MAIILTDRQSIALQKIKMIVAQQMERIRQNDPPFNVPSPWVFVETLIATHQVTRRDIAGLVKKGCLEERPSDGCGPAVRIL